jgi:microcompartment protein CcmL/EutN
MAAVDAGIALVSKKRLLVHKTVIPQPHENLPDQIG